MRDDHGLFGELRARLQRAPTQANFMGIIELVRALGDDALEYAVATLDARWRDAARELTLRPPSHWHRRGELTWEDAIARPGLLRCARVVRLGWWNRPLAPPALAEAIWAARPAQLAVAGEQAQQMLTALAARGELGWLEALEISEPDRVYDARRGDVRPSALLCALLAERAHGLKRLSMPHTPWAPALLEALARGAWWEGLEALEWLGAMAGDTAQFVDALGALRPAGLRALTLSGKRLDAAALARLTTQLGPLERMALPRAELRDEALGALAGLELLTTLDLRGNALTGATLPALTPLRALHTLTLSDNTLGEQTAALAALAAQLPALRVLELDRCGLDTASVDEVMRAAPQLERLSATQNSLTEGHALPRASDALRSLALSGSAPAAAVMDAAQGSGLAALAADDVGLVRRDCARLAGLTSLRALHIRGAEVGEEGMKRLLALPELERLEVDRREITTGVLLEALRRGRLEVLWADEHGAHPEAKRGQMTYRALCGEGCLELGGIALNRMAAHLLARSGYVTGARLVWLQDTGLGDEGLRELCARANLWAVRRLDVSGCGLTGAGVGVLGACEALRGLERLVLTGNALGADGLLALGELRALRSLEAGWTGISAASLAGLSCSAPGLERLVLEGNALGDDAAAWLNEETCAQIVELNISNTRMSAAGALAFIAKLPSLQYLQIEENPRIGLDGFCAIRDALPTQMSYVSAAKIGASEEALRAAWEQRAARDCHAGFV